MKIGDERRVTKVFLDSDARWLAGRRVKILEIDHGELWEDTVVKVKPIVSEPGQRDDVVWMNPKDFVIPSQLAPVHDAMAKELGGFRFNQDDPFGGLPVIAKEDRAQPGAVSETCYICRDPDFAARGLPLCKACPACGGHVAADDSRCDDCGLSDYYFWSVEREVKDNPKFDIRYALSKCFEDKDYEQVQPTDDQLTAAVTAMQRLLNNERR